MLEAFNLALPEGEGPGGNVDCGEAALSCRRGRVDSG